MMGIQTVEDSKGLRLQEYPPHSTIPPGQDKPSMVVEMIWFNVHSFRIEINVYSVQTLQSRLKASVNRLE